MSAQAKTAKEALDQAVTKYNHTKSVIQKSLQSADAPNERTLNNRLRSLEDALATLNITHTSWVSKAEIPAAQLKDEQFSQEWLQGEWSAVTDIQDQVDEKLSLSSVHTNTQKLTVCDNQMESLQQDISTKVDNLYSKTNPSTLTQSSATTTTPSTPFPVQAYTKILSSVKHLLSTEFTTLSETILSLDVTRLADRSKQLETFRREQQTKIAEIELRLAEHSVGNTTSPSTSHVKGIEMEKSKAPCFSGKTIDYPEFKRGWLKVPGVMWEDGNQVEQIKFKVDSHTRRLISRCNTMTEVWQVLDAEFAQEQEVINAVDEELQKLRSTDCSTPQYIVELRNFLPVLEENLRSVKGTEHLCSPDRVHFLAGKFDERTMYDWEYFKSKTEGTTYERFFKFLEDRYEACRSTIARLKSTSSSTTAINKLQSVNLLAQGATSDECRRCRSWVARDNIYTCPGCGRGTAVGEKLLHCLEHCGAYMKMTPNERSSCVESAKFCPIHLLGSHSMAGCNNQNDPKFICGIDNCQKHHHKT